MDKSWLNVASVVLGLAAWLLPVVCLLVRRWPQQLRSILAFASMTCCAASICLLYYYTSHLVYNDMSALLDTADVLPGVAARLLWGTIALNGLAFAARIVSLRLKSKK